MDAEGVALACRPPGAALRSSSKRSARRRTCAGFDVAVEGASHKREALPRGAIGQGASGHHGVARERASRDVTKVEEVRAALVRQFEGRTRSELGLSGVRDSKEAASIGGTKDARSRRSCRGYTVAIEHGAAGRGRARELPIERCRAGRQIDHRTYRRRWRASVLRDDVACDARTWGGLGRRTPDEGDRQRRRNHQRRASQRSSNVRSGVHGRFRLAERLDNRKHLCRSSTVHRGTTQTLSKLALSIVECRTCCRNVLFSRSCPSSSKRLLHHERALVDARHVIGIDSALARSRRAALARAQPRKRRER